MPEPRRRRPPWSPLGFTNAIYESDLPPISRLVAVVLRDEFYRSGRGKISITQIGNKSGLGRTTVCRHLAKLDETGYLTRKVPTKVGSIVNKARTSYALLVPAPEVRSDTQGDDDGAAPEFLSGTGPECQSGTASLSERHSTSKEEVGARSARSAGASRATAPRLIIETTTEPQPYQPLTSVITIWAGEGADYAAGRDVLARKIERLARDLTAKGFPTREFTIGPPNPIRYVELPPDQAEAARQQIAGWCRAAGYDVRFGSPEPLPDHDPVPINAPTKETTA